MRPLFFVTTITSLVLAACGSSNSAEKKKNHGIAVAVNMGSLERQNCTGKSVLQFENADGTVSIQREEYRNDFTGTTTVSADGKIFTISGYGETIYTTYPAKGDPTHREYSYVSERQWTKEELGNGIFKEKGTLNFVQTARSGLEFRDENGSPTKERRITKTYETVVRAEGNKEMIISDKTNGEELPVQDYITTTENQGSKTIVTTTLNQSYKSKIGDSEYTVKEDTLVCVKEKLP